MMGNQWPSNFLTKPVELITLENKCAGLQALQLRMMMNQNAYEILGVGVITIEDLDSCGLGKTADAIIKKIFLGLLEANIEENLSEDSTRDKAVEINDAYSLIGTYSGRQEYNEYMRCNGFSFRTSSQQTKKQVAFNDKIDSIEAVRYMPDFCGNIITSPNSYDSPSSYDDSNSPYSDSEVGDPTCHDCDQNCTSESIGCYWFCRPPFSDHNRQNNSNQSKDTNQNSNGAAKRTCDDCKISEFMKKMDIIAIFRPYIKIVRFSKNKVKSILAEYNDPKNQRKSETKESKDFREQFWNDKKTQIMIEIGSFVQECNDDSDGLRKLCALLDCTANL